MTRTKDDTLERLLHDIAHLMRIRIDEALRPHDLTHATWLAVGIVDRNERLTQSELADLLELGAAATGKLVDRLEKRDLVRRHSDPNDRRTNRLATTPKARDLMQRLSPVSEAIREGILQDLGPRDRQRLEEYLKAIKARLVARDAKAA